MHEPGGMSLLPEFLLRRLDAATRRDIFEPALYGALANHAEACAGAPPLPSSLLLVAAVLAACWTTARRAAAIDPVRALRQE